MFRHLTAGFKHALGLHRPGRKLPVRPDDLLLASYPNSGNTGLRLLIANLLHPHRAVNLGNLHQLIVDPDRSTRRAIDHVPPPRIVKSNASFDPRYQRVIYLVRDPRDVAIAQFHSLRDSHRSAPERPASAGSFENFLDLFLAGDLDRYIGSWGENVASWLAGCAHQSDFFLLRSEDLQADPALQLASIAQFAGWPATPQAISQAVSQTMSQAGDRSSTHRNHPLANRTPSILSEAQAARIESAWGDVMAYLGYELATRDPRAALNSSLLVQFADPAPHRIQPEKLTAAEARLAPASFPQPTALPLR